MSKLPPNEYFDEYIKKLTQSLDVEEEEKKEMADEWRQHLLDHHQALVNRGMDAQEAAQTAIAQFGEIDMLQKEVNETYPSSVKSHIQKEVVIAAICIIASMVGPGMLIGAHFQVEFILFSLQALMFAYVIHRFVVKRQNDWRLSLVGFLAIYAVFLQFLSGMHGTPLTFQLYKESIFTLDLERLATMNGLFEFVTLHMMWYVIVLVQLTTNQNHLPAWKRILNVSFQYWAMLLIAIFLARFQSSAEASVLLMNVFLLYAFLQQTLSIRGLLTFKEKMVRMVVR